MPTEDHMAWFIFGIVATMLALVVRDALDWLRERRSLRR